MKSNYIWSDGDFILQKEGDSDPAAPQEEHIVVEDIRCYETASGPAVFRLEDHLHQFLGTIRARGYETPYSVEDLCETVHRTLAYNRVREGKIRPVMHLSEDEFSARPVKLTVEVEDLPPDDTEEMRLHEGIPEGAALFIVWDGVIHTPLSEEFGNRITRDSVLTLARDQGFPVVERPLSYDRLYQADEAFISTAVGEITPLTAVRGRTIGDGQMGQVTQKLQRALNDTLRGRGRRSAEWLDWTWAFVGL